MLQIIQSGKQGFYMLNATQKRSTNLMYHWSKIPGDSGDVFSIKVKVYRFEPGKEEPLLIPTCEIGEYKTPPEQDTNTMYNM